MLVMNRTSYGAVGRLATVCPALAADAAPTRSASMAATAVTDRVNVRQRLCIKPSLCRAVRPHVPGGVRLIPARRLLLRPSVVTVGLPLGAYRPGRAARSVHLVRRL